MVSVFIPTFNASACIDKTLTSVLEQTYSDLEVWLVDDCSTDDTVGKLKEWQKKDPRVHLITKDHNEGFVPYSWNRVFPLLNGEFTLYLSHDDYLASDCIERLVNAQYETGVDAVIPNVIFVQKESGKEKESFAGTDNSKLSPREAFARMLNYDIPGFALWRTELIRSLGMPTEAWNSDEGMQRLWALNAPKGVTICPSAKFYYLITSSSITQGLKPYHISGLKTQKRLLIASISSGTWFMHPSKWLRFVWQFFKSYVYLKRASRHL